jgi:glycosyltransferase involved in cell wall biosynthesis
MHTPRGILRLEKMRQHAEHAAEEARASEALHEQEMARQIAELNLWRQRAEAYKRAFDKERRQRQKLRRSVSWRATRPLRSVGGALPPGLRRAARALWRAVKLWPSRRLRQGQEPPRARAEGALSPPAAFLPDGRFRALIVDDRWPQPDRDSGSLDAVNLVEGLLELGFEVTFAAVCEYAVETPYREALAQRAVTCLGPDRAPNIEAYLERQGAAFDLCVLSRVGAGGEFLEVVRMHCPRARVVFNCVDLHFLREQRGALLEGDEAVLAAAATTRAREEALARSADATIVVSAAERLLLEALAPGAMVVEMPLARQAQPPKTPFEDRRSIGFIGGFAHAPNRDAVTFFLREIWPLVRRELPLCKLSIVGPDLPPKALRNTEGAVRYLGHLPDVGPWFETLRVSVAPLRYGSGAKGKVVSSLAAGVPCVATPVAIEGMCLIDGVHVLVADAPEIFAAKVCAVYRDCTLWTQLSKEGHIYAADRFSIVAWRRRLAETLRSAGVAMPHREDTAGTVKGAAPGAHGPSVTG